MTVTNNPFLQNQRDFPDEDISLLCVQLDRMYIDVAQKVNQRTIGVFPVGNETPTGESWYISGGKEQQTVREVYKFSSTGSIAHGINFNSVSSFTTAYGSYTDGSNWYGTIYGSNVAIVGQISFYVTSTNIVVIAGAGAPSVTSGLIVLEWISVV